jgi:hypothetical protein
MKNVLITAFVLILGYGVTLAQSELPDCDGSTPGKQLKCGKRTYCPFGGISGDPNQVTCSGTVTEPKYGPFGCYPPPNSDPNLSLRCKTEAGTYALCTERAPCIKQQRTDSKSGQLVWECDYDALNIVSNSYKKRAGYVQCNDMN